VEQEPAADVTNHPVAEHGAQAMTFEVPTLCDSEHSVIFKAVVRSPRADGQTCEIEVL